MTKDEHKRRAIAALAVGTLMRESVGLILARGIEVMALKGVVLQALVYDDPADRVMNDVDLIVRPERYDDARRALEAVGYEPMEGYTDDRMTTFRRPGMQHYVDLHARLFGAGQFKLTAADLFSRSQPADFLVPGLRRPSDEDMFAHLVGHFASMSRVDQRHHPEDFERLGVRRSLDPWRVARHLHATGFGTAARVALPMIDGPFAREVLRRLPTSPQRAILAFAARQAHGRLPVTQAGALFAYDTIPGLGRRVARRSFDRLLSMNQRGRGR